MEAVQLLGVVPPVARGPGDGADDEHGVIEPPDATAGSSVGREPLGRLGSPSPEADAYVIGKLVFAVVAEALWSEDPAIPGDLDHVEAFCLAAVHRPGG